MCLNLCIDVDAEAQWYSLVCLGQFWRRISGWRWSRRFCGGGPECHVRADNTGGSIGGEGGTKSCFGRVFWMAARWRWRLAARNSGSVYRHLLLLSFLWWNLRCKGGAALKFETFPNTKSSFSPSPQNRKDTLRKAHLTQIMHWLKIASYDQCGICDHEMIRFSPWFFVAPKEDLFPW